MESLALPSLGADMDEGTLLQWLVAPGDPVHRGQIVAVVDTAKAAVDIECWQDGTVVELKVQPGQKVPVGTVLAMLDPAGEATAAPRASVPDGRASDPTAATGAQPLPAAPVTSAAATLWRPMSPAARQRARALGLAPESLTGSGPAGVVTLADVEAAADRRQASPAAAPGPEPTPPQARQRAMRQAIASAMARANREIPHYHLVETIPMAIALDWLRQRNAERPVGKRLLPAALLLKAVALCLADAPALNGHFREDRFQPSDEVRLGVAIALRGGGLVAPALARVGELPLDALMAALDDLVRRARAGSLRSSELADPSITVTALGDQGAQAVFGVIHPPQVALVGFGRILEQPWAENGWLRAMPAIRASLAADHRVSNGHLGSRFLASLRERLQQPQDLETSG